MNDRELYFTEIPIQQWGPSRPALPSPFSLRRTSAAAHKRDVDYTGSLLEIRQTVEAIKDYYTRPTNASSVPRFYLACVCVRV